MPSIASGAQRARSRVGVVLAKAADLGPDEFVGVSQAAEYLTVSYQTVRTLIRKKELRALEVVPGTFRIRRRWLDEYVEEFATGGSS